MLLPVKTPLRLVSVQIVEREGKAPLKFVKLADEETYDSCEFMLHRDASVQSLVVKARYNVTLDVDGRFTSVLLEPEKTAKAS
ncbi:MAG: hypothetical protein FWC70_12410 [Defluviitaleaceae bacterium]|nr:hypothetical protein [Defluviitaleaceae bacterium]